MTVSRWLDWTVDVRTVESSDVRQGRLRTGPDSWPLIVVEVFWGQVACWFCYAMTHRPWVLAWILVDAVLQAIRLRLKYRCTLVDPETDETTYVAMVLASTTWIVMFAAGTAATLAGGRPALFPILGIIATGGMGYAASRYAAFPRLGGLLLYVLAAPLASGALSQPGAMWLAAISPGVSVALHVMLLQNHSVLMQALVAEEENRRLSMHDWLTGLPNRLRLHEHLNGLIGSATQGGGGTRFAVLCLDLDGFKPVNDRHGHDTGDRLLQAVADRLRSGVRDRDLVCRLGGDEFVVVIADADESVAVGTAERLIGTCAAEAYDLDGGIRVVVGISVGIAIAPDHGVDPEGLLGCADNALYSSKRTAKGTWSIYGRSGSVHKPTRVDGQLTASSAPGSHTVG